MEQSPQTVSDVRTALATELKKPGSLALLFMATALAVVPALAAPEVKLPIVWPLTVLIFSIAYFWISSGALRHQLTTISIRDDRIRYLEAQPNLQMPKVVQAIPDGQNPNELLLLLNPNKLFGQSMRVSIYYENERGLELLVGNGSVANIQMNGLIQISVSDWQEPHREIRQRLIDQSGDTLGRIMVKPASNTEVAPIDLNAALLTHLMNRTGGERMND